jgi:hypothetical protein
MSGPGVRPAAPVGAKRAPGRARGRPAYLGSALDELRSGGLDVVYDEVGATQGPDARRSDAGAELGRARRASGRTRRSLRRTGCSGTEGTVFLLFHPLKRARPSTTLRKHMHVSVGPPSAVVGS